MNPILLQIANGNAFFAGMVLAGVALAWRTRTTARALSSILGVLACLGGILVIFSGTPAPIWAYGIWFVLFLIVQGMPRPRVPSPWMPRVRAAALAGLLLTSGIMCCFEVPYHLAPSISVRRGQTLYVIGDSISAGLGTKDRAWPVALGEATGLRVVNLAQPGATAESALTQADGVLVDGSTVLVEIGGNDLLDADADSTVFGTQLDDLLAKLQKRRQNIVMFELPLPPLRNGFGFAQRVLASKHHCALIPKNVMAKVLGMRGGTLDGLHLSAKGHKALATLVAGLLRIDDQAEAK